MMECPDVFALGNSNKWMLIGSLYSTNQWWIGTVEGNPPIFTAENVGIMDYGNGYAAKTGSTFQSHPTDRRVVFGFTGWSEPTVVRLPFGAATFALFERILRTCRRQGARVRLSFLATLL